ncbi:ABC transporter ATP-binding protein [Lacisediminimonas profundi]|uniref:ABC transporter ATP-binding protein n=1 Tax=Lacisediminimonas profundi TaxID=2603856 RepID=UPI00124B3DF5|nr:ABC transporter ATP-binding protein [Lacisediminimonas profundi]
MSAVFHETQEALEAQGAQATPAAAAPGLIDIDDVSVHLGEGAQRFAALDQVTLRIQPGEFVCLLGPSGCGKSTLLGALAGHLKPTRGQVLLDGKPISGPAPERGLVFQHHTLFPWLSVQDNIAYGLKMQGVARAERRRQAQAMLTDVGLTGFETRYPNALSGGMQQRVEIARVLINRPRVLLMDEPFGALDALTRLRMQELLLELWSQRRMTVVFVTHDIDEALFLADRILVMSARPGRIMEELIVPASRPRGADWLTSPAFSARKRHCLDQLRSPEGGPPLERLSPLAGPAAN